MTLQSIIPASVKVPNVFVKVSLGVGAQSPAAGGKKVLLFGNKTSAGSQAVETPVAVTSPDQARELFGAGSELHLMCAAALDAYPAIQLYAIAITEAGTAADHDVIFSGTATAEGSVIIEHMGQQVIADIAIGDAAADVASSVEAAIDAISDWPITASTSTATVTIAAKNTGPRGNLLSVKVTLENGTGISISSGDGFNYLSSGATADDPQNALDAVAATRYHYLVAPYQDATGLADFKTHVDDLAEPLEGKRSRLIAASIDTLANTTTVATGLNMPRGQMIWHYNAKQPPSILAAIAAAELAEAYETDPAFNTDGLRMRGALPQESEADFPTFTEQNSALNNGISPLNSRAGEVSLVRAVTTYSQDDNSNPDFRVIDVHYVEVADYEADWLESNWSARFGGSKLGVDVAGEVPDPGVATPNTIKDWIYAHLKDDEGELIVNVDARAAELVVEADEDTPGRVNASVPIDCIELLHQGGFDVRQVG